MFIQVMDNDDRKKKRNVDIPPVVETTLTNFFPNGKKKKKIDSFDVYEDDITTPMLEEEALFYVFRLLEYWV